MSQRAAPSSTTSSPTRGHARRSARPGRCRGSSPWSRRSTSSPTVWKSIRSRCATRSTRGNRDSRARAVERRLGAETVPLAESTRSPTADRGPLKRGIGVAQSQWVSVIHPPTACEVRILGDGSVEAFSSAQDIGTGTRTDPCASRCRGTRAARRIRSASHIGDTRYPMGPPSGGSRVTGSLDARRA